MIIKSSNFNILLRNEMLPKPFHDHYPNRTFMNRSEVREKVISSVGTLLSNVRDDKLATTADFGSFYCSVENFNQFVIVERSFEAFSDPLSIPFSNKETGVLMMFSLDGQSVFNQRSNPFILPPVSHCLNFYKDYECSNLLDAHTRQHDIAIRLSGEVYMDLLTGLLESTDNHLPAMILQQQEFNTINEHIPADAAISGILHNIIQCPFKGEMRTSFIREHLRALFSLQLYHFSPIVAGKQLRMDLKVSKRDTEILHEVKKYIDEHFLHPASLEGLSRHFGINEFKLKQSFRVLFNTSPIRYHQFKRLEYSLFLLKETDKPIKMIADEIGYSHSANYTAAFVKTFGNSPQHYRTGGKAMHAVKELEELVG